MLCCGKEKGKSSDISLPFHLELFLVLKDPVLPIEHCTLQSPGGHYFCDVENSDAFVCGQNSSLITIDASLLGKPKQ